MKGILTLTIITQRATSLNYGENIGNVSILKKLSLGDDSQITYVSDKALKYDIRRKGKEEKGWRLLDEKVKELIEKSKDGKKLNVDKFAKELIQEYREFVLFGELFTKGLFNVQLSAESIKRSKTSTFGRVVPKNTNSLAHKG
jgi:CRISPR-associated protein Cst2